MEKLQIQVKHNITKLMFTLGSQGPVKKIQCTKIKIHKSTMILLYDLTLRFCTCALNVIIFIATVLLIRNTQVFWTKKSYG